MFPVHIYSSWQLQQFNIRVVFIRPPLDNYNLIDIQR